MKRTVTFYSPGTFVAEENYADIEGKNLDEIIKQATEKAKTIVQRHNAFPYAFTVKGDKKTYYLPHCKVTKACDIPRTKENNILISNCEDNGWNRIVETTKGWKTTRPFTDDCRLLNENGTVILIS